MEGLDGLVATAAYQPEPTAAAAARRFVRDTLQTWFISGAATVGHGLVDDAVLLTSELVTNAVVHAGTPVEVTCKLTGGGVEVVVSDGHPARLVPEPPENEHIPAERTSGRGLLLPAALASAWGVTYGQAAKAVWFRIGQARIRPGAGAGRRAGGWPAPRAGHRDPHGSRARAGRAAPAGRGAEPDGRPGQGGSRRRAGDERHPPVAGPALRGAWLRRAAGQHRGVGTRGGGRGRRLRHGPRRGRRAPAAGGGRPVPVAGQPGSGGWRSRGRRPGWRGTPGRPARRPRPGRRIRRAAGQAGQAGQTRRPDAGSGWAGLAGPAGPAGRRPGGPGWWSRPGGPGCWASPR